MKTHEQKRTYKKTHRQKPHRQKTHRPKRTYEKRTLILILLSFLNNRVCVHHMYPSSHIRKIARFILYVYDVVCQLLHGLQISLAFPSNFYICSRIGVTFAVTS